MSPADTVQGLVRWACESCGETAVAQDAAWVEQARSTHACLTPERRKAADRITLALRGAYDG